jgi:hypothetical protein
MTEKDKIDERNKGIEKETIETGSDLPNADGVVSDEDVNKITDDKSDKPAGRDHSTEDYQSEPGDGVGAVQDYSDTSSDLYGDQGKS